MEFLKLTAPSDAGKSQVGELFWSTEDARLRAPGTGLYRNAKVTVFILDVQLLLHNFQLDLIKFHVQGWTRLLFDITQSLSLASLLCQPSPEKRKKRRKDLEQSPQFSKGRVMFCRGLY